MHLTQMRVLLWLLLSTQTVLFGQNSLASLGPGLAAWSAPRSGGALAPSRQASAERSGPARSAGKAPNQINPSDINYDYDFTYHTGMVQFYREGDELSYPIMYLNAGEKLVFQFDDTDADTKNYYYSIEHCNADWTPSEQLRPMDYVDGFPDDRLTDIQFSVNTIYNYTSYRFVLPNANTRIKLSGNYLLRVYIDSPDNLVFVRRFMVVENSKFQLNLKPQRAANVAKLNSHQEIDAQLFSKDFVVSNPEREIQLCLLQNYRWDNAQYGLIPNFLKGETLLWDYLDKIVFPATQEFRALDIRSLNFRTNRVKFIEGSQYFWKVWMMEEASRVGKPYLFQQDLDGRFYPDVFDFSEKRTRGDYAEVHFNFESGEFPGQSVYLLGGFNNFRPSELYKMQYNKKKGAYELMAFLKQGYYDYFYGLASPGADVADISALEGDQFETQNTYLGLVYYRPFNERYDRLVASSVIKSWN
jgi:hypothetical protein